MSDLTPVADYGWKEARNASHDYLVPGILNAMREFGIPPDALILDAGCGGGFVMDRLEAKGFNNVWGFDASESGIRVAREGFERLRDRFHVHNAYERTLPASFPQKDFRLILSVEVIEHLFSPGAYIENIRSWLAPDGIVVLTTPYHGFLKNIAIAAANKFDRHVNPLWDGGHIKFFSRATIEKLLRDKGLRPLRFFGSGRLPYLWKAMIMVAGKE